MLLTLAADLAGVPLRLLQPQAAQQLAREHSWLGEQQEREADGEQGASRADGAPCWRGGAWLGACIGMWRAACSCCQPCGHGSMVLPAAALSEDDELPGRTGDGPAAGDAAAAAAGDAAAAAAGDAAVAAEQPEPRAASCDYCDTDKELEQ